MVCIYNVTLHGVYKTTLISKTNIRLYETGIPTPHNHLYKQKIDYIAGSCLRERVQFGEFDGVRREGGG